MTFSPLEVLSASVTLQTGFNVSLNADGNIGLVDIKGWHGGPSVRRNSTERSTGHGEFSERGYRGARLITVEGHAWARTRAQAAQLCDELASVLADGTEGTFRAVDADHGERSCQVYLTGTPDVDWYSAQHINFTFDMVATDPRKYGVPVSAVTGPPVEGDGLVFDMFASEAAPGILDFGEPGDPGAAAFTNVGKADSAALLRVDGYAPGFTITERNTGNRLVYTGTIPTGSYVVLNPIEGTVLLDGYADRSEQLTVREWTRTPGESESVFLFNTEGRNARLTVEGSPAWW